MNKKQCSAIKQQHNVKISSSLSTAILDCRIYNNWQINVYFNVNCQALLGKISQRNQHINPVFSTNVLSYRPTVVS